MHCINIYYTLSTESPDYLLCHYAKLAGLYSGGDCILYLLRLTAQPTTELLTHKHGLYYVKSAVAGVVTTCRPGVILFFFKIHEHVMGLIKLAGSLIPTENLGSKLCNVSTTDTKTKGVCKKII